MLLFHTRLDFYVTKKGLWLCKPVEFTVRPFATVTSTEELSAPITPENVWDPVNAYHLTHCSRASPRCGIGALWVGWSVKPHNRFDVYWTGPVCSGERRGGGRVHLSPIYPTVVKWCDSMAGIQTRAAAGCSEQVMSQNSSLAKITARLACLCCYRENNSGGRRPRTETIALLSILDWASKHVISFQKVHRGDWKHVKHTLYVCLHGPCPSREGMFVNGCWARWRLCWRDIIIWVAFTLEQWRVQRFLEVLSVGEALMYDLTQGIAFWLRGPNEHQ